MEIEGGFDARPETRWDHLDLDPRDLVELVEALEERFAVHIPCGAWKSAATAGDAIALIQALREPALAAGTCYPMNVCSLRRNAVGSIAGYR
jgi:acyl carrier protein